MPVTVDHSVYRLAISVAQTTRKEPGLNVKKFK